MVYTRCYSDRGVVGMDAYSVIYADALAWLNDETVDYLTPQLYWQFGGQTMITPG